MSLFPSLIVGGAPKCGTSTLFRWLTDHPEVCGSQPKETFFLMDEDSPLLNRECNIHHHGLDAYGRFFPHFRGEKVLVDATTHYLYQRTTPSLLSAMAKPPRLLFVLREPAARLVSSFKYTANNLGRVERGFSLERYLDLVATRPEALAEHVRTQRSLFVLQRDVQYGRYVEYLEAYRNAVGRDNICVLTFEKLSAAPAETMKGLARWLDIDPDYYDSYSFGKQNATRALRSPWLQFHARRIASRLPRGKVLEFAKRVYYAAQETRGRRQPEPAERIARLADSYRPYNEQLAREWDLDTSAWNRQKG